MSDNAISNTRVQSHPILQIPAQRVAPPQLRVGEDDFDFHHPPRIPVRTDTRRIVCLVPAHNEEANIARTIRSLLGQGRKPDLVVIVADNCTDRTVAIARAYPVTVFKTIDNHERKAGALNQALHEYLEFLEPDDAVLVMDADTNLDESFLASAEGYLNQGYCAVGGTFTGEPGAGFLGMLQRNEYARYARDVHRRHGQALVLTGTATVFKVEALNDVIRARWNRTLPGEATVYDTRILTEDNELTLALMHLGWPIIAPADCHMTTEVMATWRDLYRQRLRWKRGALENLTDYGVTRITLRYWARQLWTLVGCLVTAAYLTTVISSLALVGTVRIHPVWLVVTAVFAMERVITVRSRGVLQMILGGILIVEMPYDIFLQGVHGKALWNTLLHKADHW